MAAASVVHLPNGQNITVTPVFGGLSFKVSELNNHPSHFPPGWTIVLHTANDHDNEGEDEDGQQLPAEQGRRRRESIHRYVRPSLRNDHLFISSISNPANSDFHPPISPTRQIAMMLWATLWWYFHQPEPPMQLETAASKQTPESARPRGEWKIYLNREGIFKGRHLLPKLERMGLVVNEDSSVGLDSTGETAATWSQVYITRRHFWHLDPRVFLFSPSPAVGSPFLGGSPSPSRTSSPNRGALIRDSSLPRSATPPIGNHNGHWTTTDPFHSNSHLPTYFPPAPTHYTWTGNVRHPHRQRPPRQGEVFYTRYIPSLAATLSFRVATLGRKVLSRDTSTDNNTSSRSESPRVVPQFVDHLHLHASAREPSDVELLHKWMNNPRVSASWGEQGPVEHQQAFLEAQLQKKHSFPVIGCFDDKPFAYFEIYWVKEDTLGRHISGSVGDWDRGIHLLVGEEAFRGPHRVKVWLSALTHYCWLADQRTQAVMLEPRVDNEKVRKYCEEVGFFKEREITFPHKQSNLMKMYRDTFESPCL